MDDNSKAGASSLDRRVKSESLQGSLMDNLPCGAGIYEFRDGQMSLIYQNKIYWELVGLNEEAYPDCSEMSAIHPDDIPVIMQELSAAVAQQRDVSCDIRLRHLTLGYRPIHLLGRIVFRENGSFLIYATFTPIPQEVMEARQQQARLALLTNSIPGGIAVYEGKPDALDAISLTYFSDGFCRLFGYTREEYEKLAKRNPLGLVTSDDISPMYKNIIALVRDGIPMDYIYRVQVKGGETKWINVKAVMGEPNGDKMTVNAVFLAMESDEAERLAEARAHSEKLSIALHAAEKSDLAKSQFLSFMSHEIRTPLNAVIGYNTIAKDEMTGAKTDEERRQANMKVLDCLTKSEVASRHLLTIINNVLDMSAIESGKLKVDDTPFDFRSLITALTVLFFSQAKAKGVDFEVQLVKPTEEWFVGDQLRINQVLTNLLSNAVKFTPEGGSVTLTITEQYIDHRSTGFRFTVSDTGIGMSQAYLEHIWTPFEQAEATISRRFGGSGLGLSITKSLVDLMGGSIAVESTPGVGSKFTVDLTLLRTDQPQKITEVDFSTVNALVVDDDGSTCDYIRLLFDRCGAKCETFTSGQAAVNALSAAQQKGTPFNLCLVDWRMPQMDGLATISEIRRIAADELPIVVVTAYDYDEIAEHAARLGISRFISKPLFQSSLFDLLATICGKQPETASQSVPKVDFDGARVLLVEDNGMNMEVAKHVLSSAHIAVDCAWNGQEAVDAFAASEPGTYRAILMDVHMPIMDGYQATRRIRKLPRPDAGSIPIIAMTADVFADDIEQASNAGMDAHVAKPVNPESLFQTLASYMAKAPM